MLHNCRLRQQVQGPLRKHFFGTPMVSFLCTSLISPASLGPLQLPSSIRVGYSVRNPPRPRPRWHALIDYSPPRCLHSSPPASKHVGHRVLARPIPARQYPRQNSSGSHHAGRAPRPRPRPSTPRTMRACPACLRSSPPASEHLDQPPCSSCVMRRARAIARPPSSLHACERARLHAVPTRSHSPPSCPPGVVRTCPPPLVATCVRAHWVAATPTHPHLHVNTSACAHAAGGSACACALARHSRDPLASHAH